MVSGPPHGAPVMHQGTLSREGFLFVFQVNFSSYFSFDDIRAATLPKIDAKRGRGDYTSTPQKKYSGVHPRVSTLIQPSFQK